MNKKITGIFICVLLIVTALPIVSSTEKNNVEYSKNNSNVSDEIRYILLENDVEIYPNIENIVLMGDNLAPNPSFEDNGLSLPHGWIHTTYNEGEKYIWDSIEAHSGYKSIGLSNIAEHNSAYGWLTKHLIPVNFVNYDYVFSVFYKFNRIPPNRQVAQVLIMFYDENGEMLNYPLYSGWLARLQYSLDWRRGVMSTSPVPEHERELTKFVELNFEHWAMDSTIPLDPSVEVRFDDVFFGTVEGVPPNKPDRPRGSIIGESGNIYSFSSSTIDFDNHNVSFFWDFGEGRNYSVTDWIKSGESCTVNHTWENEGIYYVAVIAMDETGLYSEWSDVLPIFIPKNKSIKSPFIRFLDQHPHLFPILRQLLGL